MLTKPAEVVGIPAKIISFKGSGGYVVTDDTLDKVIDVSSEGT